MKMKNLSKRFDKDLLHDAYTGEFLYKGQFATYDGNSLDGSFIRRRTVSLSPDLVLPERRVVTVLGEQWVLSDPIFDGYNGKAVRQTMSARKCHALFELKTAHELALHLPTSRQAYGFRRWIKATADAAETYMEPYSEFSFSVNEAPMTGRFIVDGGRVWSPRFETDNAEGFRFIEGDELVAVDEIGQVYVEVSKDGEFNPVTFESVEGEPFTALLVDRYVLFKKLDQAQPNNYAGDKTLIVSKQSDEKPAGNYSINGQKWGILGTHDLIDGWAVHIRRLA